MFNFYIFTCLDVRDVSQENRYIYYNGNLDDLPQRVDAETSSKKKACHMTHLNSIMWPVYFVNKMAERRVSSRERDLAWDYTDTSPENNILFGSHFEHTPLLGHDSTPAYLWVIIMCFIDKVGFIVYRPCRCNLVFPLFWQLWIVMQMLGTGFVFLFDLLWDATFIYLNKLFLSLLFSKKLTKL